MPSWLAPPDVPGARIIAADTIGTVVFVVTAVAAAIEIDTFGLPAVIVALVLFGIGTVAFLVSYGKAVSRSRYDELSVAGLYFLAGGAAPRPVRVRLLALLAVQVVVAVATASVRPFTSVAFGILVPMFGLACCGLWGAFHGAFPARSDPRASLPADE